MPWPRSLLRRRARPRRRSAPQARTSRSRSSSTAGATRTSTTRRPVSELDSFAIPEALDESFAFGFGDLSIHEFATDPTENLAYSSYYAGGIRVFRFSRADRPRARWARASRRRLELLGRRAVHAADGKRLIAGSDRDFGLVILRYTGPGAALPPSCSDADGDGAVQAARCGCRSPARDANGNPLRQPDRQGPAGGTIADSTSAAARAYTHNGGFIGPPARSASRPTTARRTRTRRRRAWWPCRATAGAASTRSSARPRGT